MGLGFVSLFTMCRTGNIHQWHTGNTPNLVRRVHEAQPVILRVMEVDLPWNKVLGSIQHGPIAR